MTFRLPYPPSVNRLYRVIRGRMVMSDEARAYKALAGLLARQQGVEVLCGAVSVTISVFRPRRAGDLDNTLKATLDALNGIAYEDDSQITELHARRYEQAKERGVRRTGYIEVTVSAARVSP